jgi:Zn-finger protein
MKNSSRFFANKECEYYPCHKGIEDLNCMFCYCPFYMEKKCPGNPHWIHSKKNDRLIKDCTNCTFPHRPENYDVIIRWIISRNNS